MTFKESELAYLGGQSLGRLATIGPTGVPQVRPVGFWLNEDGTIDIGGPGLSASQKYRNLKADPRVAFVVDDMTPDEPGAVKPGWGRGVEIRGRAELFTDRRPAGAPPFFSEELIRIHPEKVNSWHLEP
ncbi:PPOX class F420-dependent oxidoreductase [Kitasatospora sp. NPDC057015]|uniref:PPOX class F420-dependent oxidoreductase n=1 Tax=Kitasatospora sp. NPDC057015 TaxID=3346001 RepID=UPI00363CA55E